MTGAVFAHHGERLLYKVAEAAGILAVSESKLWELLARGEVKSLKIDGSRRISRAALEEYVTRLAGDRREPPR
jgi:excisionase family DNA binding protein